MGNGGSVPELPVAKQHEAERPTGRRDRLAGLDGLRGLAVAAVVVFHAFPEVLPGGFVGVDVFFVLSGFLITRGILDEKRRGVFSLARFYRRRARRILPALLVLLLVWSLVVVLVGGPLADGYSAQVLGALGFSGNWVSIVTSSSYFLAGSPEVLKHLWSLGVEEQFYLVFPLLLLMLLRLRDRGQITVLVALAAASATAMAMLAVPRDPSRVYYGTDTHSFGLLIGAAVAVGSTRLPVSNSRAATIARLVIGSLALVGLVWCATHLKGAAAFTYLGGLVGVTLLAAALLAALATGGDDFGTLLDIAPLSELGRRSYGIYLWHWPFLVAADVLVPSADSDLGAAVTATAIAASLVCAWLSFRFVERPVLHGRRSGRRSMIARPFSRAVVSGGIVAVALIVMAASVVADRPSPAAAAAAQVERGAAAIRHHEQHQTAASPAPSAPIPAPAATPGSGRSARVGVPRTITAIGDSVMLASATALLHRFPDANIDAVVSRQAAAAPAILESDAAHGRLADVVVVGLGTNGALGASTLDRIRASIGGRRLVLVDVHADRPWTAGVNEALDAYAVTHPHVIVAHWNHAITAQPGLLGPDGIHPGQAGGRLYTDVVTRAVRAVCTQP